MNEKDIRYEYAVRTANSEDERAFEHNLNVLAEQGYRVIFFNAAPASTSQRAKVSGRMWAEAY